MDVCVLVSLILAVAGCGQTAPPADPSTETAGDFRTGEQDSEIRVVEAETTVRPTDTSAQLADAAAAGESDGAKTPAGLPAGKAPIPLDDPQAAALTMPRVFLTQGHAETCRVQVGDTLPDVQLADLDGPQQSLAKMLGSKLTVVVFWKGAKPTALEELRDLGPDVLSRYSGNGVAVVGINTGDNPQLARELVKQNAARFPNLSDPDGAALKQVASGKLPRTYLVDRAGKILWFDLEYSQGTRRELVQAIRYTLAHQ